MNEPANLPNAQLTSRLACQLNTYCCKGFGAGGQIFKLGQQRRL